MISVIIPYFNAKEWIAETLESVLKQDIKDLEIIVVDDGSTDGAGSFISKFPLVRYIRTENRGPSKARNLGIELAKGEFIQFLDADDLLANGKLKTQLTALKNTEADIAYGDWQKLIKESKTKYIKGEIVKRQMQNPQIELFVDFWAPAAVYLFSRSIVKKVGGFRENLPVIQDARFVLDCALEGASFVYCQGLMGYYRVHNVGSVSTKDERGFLRDCLVNVQEIEEYWQRQGGINQERKEALVKVYSYLVRESFNKEMAVFDRAYKALNRLAPGYVPTKSKLLRWSSKILGYRKAAYLAFYYKKIKKGWNFQ